MKKIVCAIIVAASVVACGKVDNSMYFDTSDKRVFEDATAEMDTLSYAVGMNLGLGLRYKPEGMDFNYEVLMDALKGELAKDVVDYNSLDENKALVKRFASERLQPYSLAKHVEKSRADASANLDNMPITHTLYNEEFTRESVSVMYGRDMAYYIMIAAYPLNMHWFYTAMDEASKVEGQIIHDSLMRLSVRQMRGSIQNYHVRIHPEYIARTAREWLEDVAKQPNVNTMVIDEFDTLYFRVNKAGNGVKPRSLNDTISFSYDLYTRSGKLVESHTQRADMVREALEKEKAANAEPDGKSAARIQQLSDQLNSIENLRIPVSKSLLKGLQYAVQNVGEGGEITVWMPSSLAFGERGNRVVHGHDAVVMNIHLKSVSYGPTDEELAAMEEEAKRNTVKLPNGALFSPKQRIEKDKNTNTPFDNKVIVTPVGK